MNGEVTQASRIVAAARKAMKDGSEYEFTPLKYEGSTTFNFCDRKKSGAPLFRAKHPADWYAHIAKEGVKNIFMILGMRVNRMTLGYSNNSAVSIFVRYEDDVVTRFVPHWSFNDDTRLWSIEYTEAIAENAPATDPEFRNEKSMAIASLTDVADLAQQLGQEQFVKTFKKAEDILNGTAAPVIKSGAAAPAIPEDYMKYYLAADAADVFGAMGSWNDEPASAAREQHKDKDYATLSDRLLCSVRLMTMYAVNFPIN